MACLYGDYYYLCAVEHSVVQRTTYFGKAYLHYALSENFDNFLLIQRVNAITLSQFVFDSIRYS